MTKRKMETLEIEGDGNTIPPQSQNKRATQLKFHSFTWNNYPIDAVDTLETTFKPSAKRYVFQEERGAQGTPHIQGTIETIKKMRSSEFYLPTQIHWEKTRNVEASFKYCAKQDSKIGETYSFGMPKPLRLIQELRPWQQQVFDLIKNECTDDRTINWYWDAEGNKGKTSFVKYCCATLNAIMLTYGKASDLINSIYNADMDKTNIIFLDIPRIGGNKVSYTAIESIKNGIIANTKYETGMKLFNSPHIVIFANEPPNTTSLSADRWNIVELN